MVRYATILIAAVFVLACGIFAAGCMGTTPAASGEIKKFGSADEIGPFIKENLEKTGGLGAGVTDGSFRVAEESLAAPASQSAVKSVSDAISTGASRYSTTTVQVAGVDEPDFVKNDGRYIYIIAGNRLVIVDAYPAENAQTISETEIDDTVQEIFVNGDRLILFSTGVSDGSAGTSSGSAAYAGKVAVMPYYQTMTVTSAAVYDISNRKNPALIKQFTIDGDYVDARMIQNRVYLLTREYLYSYDTIVVPAVREGDRVIAEPDVYYFDNPETRYAFSTVTALDMAGASETDAKTFLLGSGNILYVSPDALYISYQRWHPVYRTYDDSPAAAVSGLIVQDSAGSAVPAGITFEEFNKLSEEEKQEVIADLREGDASSARAGETDQTTTVIHKIAIGNGKIAYIAQGEVPGYLKNQFSMDEYGDNLRIATTSDVWTRGGQNEYNNVFVLDSGMKTIGSLTHIAGQETIYAARFIGDRLYLVTFKRIDPFFVIDLSDPAKPAILGKLKIPGYSDYLYPYDKNAIIGVGKETATNDWGGTSTRGVKLALFDVTDVENPRQIDKVEIGESGTDSAALTDHKAFLFDKEKNLLVLPIRQLATREIAGDAKEYTGQQVWYGAYVFGISPETGFVLRGTVEHGITSGGSSWYGSSANEVKRSLYIGDDLYTISTAKIVASSLADVNTTIKTIGLSGGPDYPDLPEKTP